MKARKKPVIVEFEVFEGYTPELEAWLGNAYGGMDGSEMIIQTLEDGSKGQAKHVASPGDIIIKGVRGEFYPCKPDIFWETYEEIF